VPLDFGVPDARDPAAARPTPRLRNGGSTVSAQHQSLGTRSESATGAPSHQQVPIRADERQIEQVIDMLAKAISAQDEAAGAERALVQALDRLRIVWRFRPGL